MTAFKKLEGKRYENGSVFALRPVGELYIKTNNSALEPVDFDGAPVEHTCGMSRKAVNEETFKKFEAAAKEVMASADGKAILKKWGYPSP